MLCPFPFTIFSDHFFIQSLVVLSMDAGNLSIVASLAMRRRALESKTVELFRLHFLSSSGLTSRMAFTELSPLSRVVVYLARDNPVHENLVQNLFVQENAVLEYCVQELFCPRTFCPSTRWHSKHDGEFQSMSQLIALMKSHNIRSKRKKAKTFTSEKVFAFHACHFGSHLQSIQELFFLGISGRLRMHGRHCLVLEGIIPVDMKILFEKFRRDDSVQKIDSREILSWDNSAQGKFCTGKFCTGKFCSGE